MRNKIEGTAERPRLSVYRSNEHIYAQVIDDIAQKTLAHTSSLSPALKEGLGSGATVEAASKVGGHIAELCAAANIEVRPASPSTQGFLPSCSRVPAMLSIIEEGRGALCTAAAAAATFRLCLLTRPPPAPVCARVQKVVFDRGGKLYHGRIKAVAEAAREKGLVF
mmetsp:Transcript_65339/g.206450  ORF Transcript_65339/g.206450 Transcript_65339/m.206450 type:complete len:166 (+) Transcript_65339:397-894(+)